MTGLESAEYVDIAALKEQAATEDSKFASANSAIASLASTRPAELAGQASEIASQTTVMTNAINWYAEKNAYFTRFFEKVKSSTTDYYGVFVQKRTEVEELRKKVDAERQLEAIRQEQVKSLENRNEANFHSSWMGLVRPLKPESQVGLAVAAAVFALVVLLAAVFLYQNRAPDFGFFRGGFRLRKGRYFV